MISVVTITFNNFLELKASLSSLGNNPEVESVVINGGEDEDSCAFLSTYSGISVVENDRGIADAFNKGFRHSKGVAVAYLNSGDILLDPEYYRWANSVFTYDSTASFVYSDIMFIDPNVGRTRMKPRGKNINDLGAGIPFPHPSMIVRREVFNQIGGFSEDYRISMDFDFVVKLLNAGHRGIYYPHATVEMNGRGVSTAKELQGIQECKKSLERHGLFYGKIRWGFEIRVLCYYMRSFVQRSLGNKALSFTKYLKNTLKLMFNRPFFDILRRK